MKAFIAYFKRNNSFKIRIIQSILRRNKGFKISFIILAKVITIIKLCPENLIAVFKHYTVLQDGEFVALRTKNFINFLQPNPQFCEFLTNFLIKMDKIVII